MMNDNIKAGADIHAGDGGYSEGTKEGYEAFVKIRNKSLGEGRIREIAEQCNIGKLVDTWEYQKFAELIVSDIIANVKEWEKDSRNHISYMLKNHYGTNNDKMD